MYTCVYIYYCVYVVFFLMSLPTSSSNAQTQIYVDVTDFYIAFRLGSSNVLQIYSGKSHDLPFFLQIKVSCQQFSRCLFCNGAFWENGFGLEFFTAIPRLTTGQNWKQS